MQDWSSRHVRLRFELIGAAILIAAYAIFEAKPHTSLLIPIDFDDISAGWIITALTMFYFITLGHFYVRTRTEMQVITQETEQLTSQIEKIRVAEVELNASLSSPDTERLVEAVKILRDDLGRDMDLQANFRRLLQQISKVGSEQREAHRILTGPEPEEPLTDQIKAVVGQSAQTLARNEERMRGLTTTLDAVSEFYLKGIPDAIEAANAARLNDLTSIASFRAEIRSARNLLSIERLVLSCWLPATISLALVVISLAKFGIQWLYGVRC